MLPALEEYHRPTTLNVALAAVDAGHHPHGPAGGRHHAHSVTRRFRAGRG